jgi:hypothetical protein
MSKDKSPEYPRIRDLPEEEQEPFSNWMTGQTMPICDTSLPQSEWDWYYPWDYETWKAGRPPLD